MEKPSLSLLLNLAGSLICEGAMAMGASWLEGRHWLLCLAALALTACSPVRGRFHANFPDGPARVSTGPEIIAPGQMRGVIGEPVLPGEQAAVDASIARITAGGARVLKCPFPGDAGSMQQAVYGYYWYGFVGMPQRDLVFISPAHPLGRLGDTPRTTCPASRAEAKALANEMFRHYDVYLFEYQRTLRNSPHDPGAPRPIGLGGCVRFIADQTIENDCAFPVALKWCSDEGVGRACMPAYLLGLEVRQQHHFTLGGDIATGRFRYNDHVSFIACAYPYIPTLPPRAEDSWDGMPWRCKREPARTVR